MMIWRVFIAKEFKSDKRSLGGVFYVERRIAIATCACGKREGKVPQE